MRFPHSFYTTYAMHWICTMIVPVAPYATLQTLKPRVSRSLAPACHYELVVLVYLVYVYFCIFLFHPQWVFMLGSMLGPIRPPQSIENYWMV